MLVPLTREKFEQLLPAVATGSQYKATWGRLQDFLRRLLISAVGMIILLALNVLFGGSLESLKLFLGIIMAFYWLWSPVYFASVRNGTYRRFKYSGFWRGRILDVFISDDLVGEEKSVNKRGELVIIENRQRRINLEIGDETGFKTIVKAPLRRVHKLLAPGQVAEGLVMSNQADLSRIDKMSDIFIPSQDLWVGEYPCLRRDFFKAVSQELARKRPPESKRRQRKSDEYPRERRVY